MTISAKAVRALTGAKTKSAGLTQLYALLELRQWFWNGRVYTTAGYDAGKDLVHFTATWAAAGGGVGHSRLALPLLAALHSKDGNLAEACILH